MNRAIEVKSVNKSELLCWLRQRLYVDVGLLDEVIQNYHKLGKYLNEKLL